MYKILQMTSVSISDWRHHIKFLGSSIYTVTHIVMLASRTLTTIANDS